MLIYVRGGQSYSTKIPLGSYHIRCAAGEADRLGQFPEFGHTGIAPSIYRSGS
jgi:hypothetical protein